MDPEYIVVQAGGKGTRMEHYTANKPKALVSINNRPILFHLFERYPDKKFIVIGDYKIDVMRRYLSSFAKVKYIVVDAEGKTGTSSGVKSAVSKIPDGKSFMLIWSDLVLPDDFQFPQENGNYVGLSESFPCRWSFQDDKFAESPSTDYGVAGMFIFEDKSLIDTAPESGEFVRWLQGQKIQFKGWGLKGGKEFGLISVYEQENGVGIEQRCRPFNKIEIEGDVITKSGVDDQGRGLAVRERAWYEYVKERGFGHTPRIYSTNPLKMERVNGRNVFEYDFDYEQRAMILKSIIGLLKDLHGLGSTTPDYFSIDEAYVGKTMSRLDKVRDLVPFGNEKSIVVNGRECRNIFYYLDDLRKRFEKYQCAEFQILHGDCTFSNILLRDESEPLLIDPRGYFGYTEMYGDPVYDWAKLYYSLAGDYDQFNLKRFLLTIGDDKAVKLDIETNGWKDVEPLFFDLLKDDVNIQDIKLIHAVIWLSLTTYAWDDYDSICAAFYNGLYYLEESL